MSLPRQHSIKRTISSKSLAPPFEESIIVPTEDEYSMGDSEMHIEYHNVPKRLLIQGALHTLIQFRFFPLLAVILGGVILLIASFAGVYLAASNACGLDLNSYKDAWLFSMLVHFKSVLSPVKQQSRFWNGCPEGCTALFFHLFVGHILGSVLLSSLAFNFQSISRRSVSLFTTLTMNRTASVKLEDRSISSGPQAFLLLDVVELNEAAQRKVSDVKANVFVLDPTDSTIRNILCNKSMEAVFIPQQLKIPIPMDLVINNYTLAEKNSSCSVCGKTLQNSLLAKHLSSCEDDSHASAQKAFVAELKALPALRIDDVVGKLRRREVEFIVILEGCDPITTDRVQVQKIFRRTDIVPFLEKLNPIVSVDAKDSSPVVDYKIFL